MEFDSYRKLKLLVVLSFTYYLSNVEEQFSILRYASRNLRAVHNPRTETRPESVLMPVLNIPRISVSGAIIMSEVDKVDPEKMKNIEVSRTWRDAYGDDPNVVNATFSSYDALMYRINHARTMYRSLPFPVVEWPAVFTKACPKNRVGKHDHKTERGLALAHFQIWLEFIYFDPDVIEAYEKGLVKGIFTSSTWTSTSAVFSVSENGTYYKDGVPYTEDDIIVIFEDDADIAIVEQDLNSTLFEELSQINADILYLGWCEGRLAKPVPLCAHAYAITRRGARQAVKYFEPCGLAVDLQLVRIVKNKYAPTLCTS